MSVRPMCLLLTTLWVPSSAHAQHDGALSQPIITIGPHQVRGASLNQWGPRNRPGLIASAARPAPRLKLHDTTLWQAIDTIRNQTTGNVLIVDCHGNFDHHSVQEAIKAADDGDVIVVLPNTCNALGHYFENIDFLGKAITVQSVLPDNSDVVESTVINGSNLDLSTVRFVSAEGRFSILAGLTITGGRGTVDAFLDEDILLNPHVGGGVVCFGSSPVIRDCRIVGNQAALGGGLAAIDSDPELLRCRIAENVAWFEVLQPPGLLLVYWPSGGGAVVLDGTLTIRHSGIDRNRVDAADAAGLWPQDLRLAFGGGLAVWAVDRGRGAVVLENCNVRHNRIINTAGAAPTVPNPLGGGIFHQSASDVVLHVRNSIIASNQAGGGGAGIRSNNAVIEGCTISLNGDPLALHAVAAAGTITNSIIRQNLVSIGDVEAGAAISYSDVETPDGSSPPGEGNINADAMFVAPAAGDFRLLPGSPCIDAGDPQFVAQEGETDVAGLPRVINDRVDMGAHEFTADCNGNGVPDVDDIAGGSSLDCNANGLPDECESDCNANGVADVCDISAGTSEDCNLNTVPDECESPADCNANGVRDFCDLFDGSSSDCNQNAIPDECDTTSGDSDDCNNNLVPDECEPDCNSNGVADPCDVGDGVSEDCNLNLVPDECEEGSGQPVIVVDPSSVVVPAGELAQFAVQADGLGLQYQWRKDGGELVDDGRIVGSRTPVLLIIETQLADAGLYECAVTNFDGCALSDPAALTVTISCPDLTGDGLVLGDDLAVLLGDWGSCTACPSDLNHDGVVDARDLAELLARWGVCP